MSAPGELYPQLIRRRSIRSYDMERPVPDGLIEELVDFLSALSMPQGGIDWNFDTLPYTDMVSIAAVEPGVKAPMYLVLRAEKVNFALQNSGYLGELAALWLCSRGVASCWQGAINVTEDFPDTLPFIAALAFGWSDEPFRTSAGEAKRKPVEKLTMGEFSGDRLKLAEAVSLAPSWLNRQPVRLLAREGGIHVFRKHVLLRNPVISYAQCLDTGAALAHMQVAAEAQGQTLCFTRRNPPPEWGNNIYQITVTTEQ